MKMEQLLLIFLFVCLLIPLICADCTLKNANDERSKELLKRLEPIKGQSFVYTYTDEKVNDKYVYTFSVCEKVSVAGFENLSPTGVLQEDKQNPSNRFKRVGLTNSTIIKGGTDWIMLTYTNGDAYRSHCFAEGQSPAHRQAHIMIVCDPYEEKGQFKVLYENNKEDNESGCFYMMELSSKVACTYANRGLSAGSVLLIIFFTLVGMYLIVGALYKRCVYGSKGWQQVPNVAFWKTCGSLQADGCDFLCRCNGSGYSTSRPYQGIADDQLEDEIDDEHLLPM